MTASGTLDSWFGYGHTIREDIEFRSNSVGLDTGAYLHGRLSALAIEGGAQWFLEATC